MNGSMIGLMVIGQTSMYYNPSGIYPVQVKITLIPKGYHLYKNDILDSVISGSFMTSESGTGSEWDSLTELNDVKENSHHAHISDEWMMFIHFTPINQGLSTLKYSTINPLQYEIEDIGYDTLKPFFYRIYADTLRMWGNTFTKAEKGEISHCIYLYVVALFSVDIFNDDYEYDSRIDYKGLFNIQEAISTSNTK